MKLFGRILPLMMVAVLAGTSGCSGSWKAMDDAVIQQGSRVEEKPGSQVKKAGRAKGPIAPPRRDVPGERGELSIAKIYVPDHFAVRDGEPVDVVVWFLGAPWCAEQVFYDSGKNGVFVVVTVKELWETFRHEQALGNLLEESRAWLSERSDRSMSIGRVCLASFSGGYVAVREILKQPRYRERISDVVLADSLYAPRVEGNEKELDSAAMEPFLNYARRAVAGECNFIFSHLYPPLEEHRGNTTTLAANYLIERLGITRTPVGRKNSGGIPVAYKAESNGFHVFGYTGMTTQDHFEHFYKASDLLRLTSFASAK